MSAPLGASSDERQMRRPYYVISPEYSSGGGAYEPPEWGCDCVEVEARTKREAVILGVRKILREQGRGSWAETNRSDGQSPFTGYRADLARCGHGYPIFILVSGRAVSVACWGCEEESRRFQAEEDARCELARTA